MSDWARVPIGTLGKTYAGLSGKRGDDFGEGSPYIPYMNIFSSARIDPSRVDRVRIEVGERQNRVQCGDIFFTTSSETVEDVGTSSVLTEDMEDTYLNSFCFGFRLHSFDQLLPEFAAYLLRGQQCRKAISDLGQGSTRYNLPKTILLQRLSLHLPPLPEQRKIASILTTVDSLIEQTEALIEKYRWVKQGMMADLLSRGVDSDGKLRPTQQQAPELYKQSELGWIPREWDVTSISSVSSLITKGATPTTYGFDFVEEGVRFVRGENLSDVGEYSGNNRWISSAANEFLRRSRIRKDDIILGIVGTLGKHLIVTRRLLPANISQNVALIRCRPSECLPAFLTCFLQSHGFVKQVQTEETVQAQPSLNLAQVGAFQFALPSTEEQHMLVIRLHALDCSVDNERTSLAKLRTLKTGLMQDLLTGKVRVKVDQAEQTTQPTLSATEGVGA